MASKNNKKNGKKVAKNVEVIEKYVQRFVDDEYETVMGGAFLKAGYSLEEGIEHSDETETTTIGLVKKALSKLGIFDSSATGLAECKEIIKQYFAAKKA